MIRKRTGKSITSINFPAAMTHTTHRRFLRFHPLQPPLGYTLPASSDLTTKVRAWSMLRRSLFLKAYSNTNHICTVSNTSYTATDMKTYI